MNLKQPSSRWAAIQPGIALDLGLAPFQRPAPLGMTGACCPQDRSPDGASAGAGGMCPNGAAAESAVGQSQPLKNKQN